MKFISKMLDKGPGLTGHFCDQYSVWATSAVISLGLRCTISRTIRWAQPFHLEGNR